MRPDGDLVILVKSTLRGPVFSDYPFWKLSQHADGFFPVPGSSLVFGKTFRIEAPDKTVLWTAPSGGLQLIMQSDRNLVLYGKGFSTVWKSNTSKLLSSHII